MTIASFPDLATASEKWSAKRRDTFNALYAKYLRANATALDPESAGKACEIACDEADVALWQIIRMPSELAYQIGYKIGICRELLSAQWNDNRCRAMFESIVSDCNRIGDLGDFE
jgi:hypothetical protein